MKERKCKEKVRVLEERLQHTEICSTNVAQTHTFKADETSLALALAFSWV